MDRRRSPRTWIQRDGRLGNRPRVHTDELTIAEAQLQRIERIDAFNEEMIERGYLRTRKFPYGTDGYMAGKNVAL